MKYALSAIAFAGALAGCNRSAPPAESSPPEEARAGPAEAPVRWAAEAPDGWEVARVDGGGWSVTAAIAAEPAAGAETPVGRVTLKRAGAVVAQRPLGELLTVPDGESWTVFAARQAAGDRHFVTIYAGGVVGADYLEHKKALAILPDDPKALEALWSGDGGWEQSMMGSCETGVTLGFGVEGGALVIARAPYGRWVAEPPEEDWQREIHAQCEAPKAPPGTRIPLK